MAFAGHRARQTHFSAASRMGKAVLSRASSMSASERAGCRRTRGEKCCSTIAYMLANAKAEGTAELRRKFARLDIRRFACSGNPAI